MPPSVRAAGADGAGKIVTLVLDLPFRAKTTMGNNHGDLSKYPD